MAQSLAPSVRKSFAFNGSRRRTLRCKSLHLIFSRERQRRVEKSPFPPPAIAIDTVGETYYFSAVSIFLEATTPK